MAALLALLPGIFGIMGIGHIYVGKFRRGMLILAVGLLLNFLTWASFTLSMRMFGFGFMASFLFGIVLLVVWVGQVFDAYRLAGVYNRHVQAYGRPW